KMAADGRADRQVDHASRTDPYSVTVQKPQPDRNYGQQQHGAPVQLKADIALRMQRDNREGASAVSKRADVQEQSNRVDNSFGREKPAAPIPLKTQIVMKMQNGDNREGGLSHKVGAANNSDRMGRSGRTARGDGDHAGRDHTHPLSREDK